MADMGPPESRAGSAGIGSMIMGMIPGGKLLQGLGGLLGGLANNKELEQTRSDINNMAGFTDQNADFGFGRGFAGGDGQNTFQFDAQNQALQQLLQGSSGSLLGGGLFNDPRFQQAFQGNDIAGALAQAQGSLGMQAGNTAFGGLQGLNQQATGLSNLFANQVAGGPQDQTGGLMGQLMGQGFGNQLAAGDQSGLFNQSLATQRAAATNGGLLDTAINKFRDAGFATGRSGTSAGARDQEGFLNQIAQQDLGFQNNAFGQAQQRAQLLGNLGSQQIGQGAGFLGQNLGQFNQQAQFANMFGQQAQGLEGQGFNQMLQALQQNQSAGTQRLQNAQGLFGMGVDTLGQQIGLGQSGAGVNLDFNNLALQSMLGLRGAETDRIAATGQHAGALADTQGSSGGGIGGFVSNLFSDKRLKDNITLIGTLGEHNWYEWDWNEKAVAIGANTQDSYGVLAQEVAIDRPDLVKLDDTGYLQVDYAGLL